jgi:hypothetical protein
MANEPSYSTFAGIPTADEAYRLLLHHISEARNQCLVISHLRMTEDDNRAKLIAKGWAGMEEMLAMVQEQVRQIAMKRMV